MRRQEATGWLPLHAAGAFKAPIDELITKNANDRNKLAPFGLGKMEKYGKFYWDVCFLRKINNMNSGKLLINSGN